MRPRRFLSAVAVLVLLGAPACVPSFEGVAAFVSPEPSTPSASPRPSAPPIDCPRKPVTIRFKFHPDTTQEDRALIKDALTKARKHFPLRYPRASRYSYAQSRNVCVPATYSEPVVTTFGTPEGETIAFYRWGHGMRFYVGIDAWKLAPEYFKYLYAFHEAYHWFQHLAQKSYAPLEFGRDALPFWLVEGSAEWSAYQAAIKFGLYPSMDEARAFEARYVEHQPTELSKFEDPTTEGADYPFYFGAVDALLRKHGGKQALTEYWSFPDDDVDWRVYFERAFGITVKAFYKEFSAG